MNESLKAAFNRQPYVGGNPSDAEKLVWAYRYWRAVKVNKTGMPGFGAKEAFALAATDARIHNKVRYASSAETGAYGPAFTMRGAKAMRWIEKPSACGLRFVGYAGKLARLNHDGWYIDNDQSETVQGVVFQLPGRKGKALFVSGYDNPWNGKADSNGPVCLDFDDVEIGDNEESDNPANMAAAIDAAGYADQLAEWMAEDEREYRAASSAGARYAELGEDIGQRRAEVKASIDQFKRARKVMTGRGESGVYDRLCSIIRGDVANELREIAKARAERAKLMEGDYVSEWLPGWNTRDSRLVEAFNEAVGIHA